MKRKNIGEELPMTLKLQYNKKLINFKTKSFNDIQLSRFKNEVESLKKEVSQTQAELKGEAGVNSLSI